MLSNSFFYDVFLHVLSQVVFFHTHTHSRLFVNFIHITLVTHWALLHGMPSCEHGTIHSSFFGAPGKLFPFCCCYKEHCYEHSHVGLPM